MPHDAIFPGRPYDPDMSNPDGMWSGEPLVPETVVDSIGEQIYTPVTETIETVIDPIGEMTVQFVELAETQQYDFGVLFGVLVGVICVCIWAVTFKL